MNLHPGDMVNYDHYIRGIRVCLILSVKYYPCFIEMVDLDTGDIYCAMNVTYIDILTKLFM
jgi:hypothetical protein